MSHSELSNIEINKSKLSDIEINKSKLSDNEINDSELSDNEFSKYMLSDMEINNFIRSYIEQKIKSGFYLDKISIDADAVESYKEKDNIRLTFMNGILLDNGDLVENGGDYVSIYLPLPLRFDEEWFKKYKKINLTVETIRDCFSEEYLNEA